MRNLIGKTVKVEYDINDDVHVLIGVFAHEARKQGWSKDEIDIVIDKCKESDHDNFMLVLLLHTEKPNHNDNIHQVRAKVGMIAEQIRTYDISIDEAVNKLLEIAAE